MIYFDTSYILKCYLNESKAELVRALAGQEASKYCCRWGRAEFFAGIKRQTREAKITPQQETEILRVFKEDEAAAVWLWLPMEQSLLNSVCAAFEGLPATVPVRAGDAIHLICAREHGFTEIYSNDRHLLAAAPHFGLAGKNVIV